MKIKIINFGGKFPERAHYNDASADVFASIREHGSITIEPGEVRKVSLGIGIELPDGCMALVLPRSGLSSKTGLTTESAPIDSGYTGEIHAIVFNASNSLITISDGDKIAQLVVIPIVVADFITEDGWTFSSRNSNGFGSTDVSSTDTTYFWANNKGES